ncbi:MAG: methylmalonyl-CoA epimerase [Deltaproteobacteria bacterium]|nr:methylmalonyl-CoA epimerase [Deltaproteobacteria bacterium]
MIQGGKIVDQVSIAVFSIEKSLVFYEEILGSPLQTIEEVPSEQVRVAILQAKDTRIELLEPMSQDSPISAFLEKRGEGVHHIAYQVDDLAFEVKRLQAKGVRFIEPLIRDGSENSKIAFIHPKSAHGVLTELVQRA